MALNKEGAACCALGYGKIYGLEDYFIKNRSEWLVYWTNGEK